LERVMGHWCSRTDPHHPLSPQKGFDLESKFVSNKVKSTTLKGNTNTILT